MTTTITVTTHDWPVEITKIDFFGGDQTRSVTETRERVEPNSTATLHIHSHRSLHFAELPIEQPVAQGRPLFQLFGEDLSRIEALFQRYVPDEAEGRGEAMAAIAAARINREPAPDYPTDVNDQLGAGLAVGRANEQAAA
jgi:hypothetical protein